MSQYLLLTALLEPALAVNGSSGFCSLLTDPLVPISPPLLSVCPSREQENNSKHLQLVSGAPPTAFWLANYCWDIINFTLPAAGIVLLMWGYNQPQLAGSRLAATAVLLWVFGSAGINLTYLCHFMFKVGVLQVAMYHTKVFVP